MGQKLKIVGWLSVGALAGAMTTNIVMNTHYPEISDAFPFLGVAVWVVIFALAAGASLWRLPADRFPRMRMAAAALWLSPFALFGGGGWTGAAILVGGGLGYAAWQGLASLTRRPPGTPPA